MQALPHDTKSRPHGSTDFAVALERLAADRPHDELLVCASFSLEPDDTGSPAAVRVLRQAAREALPADAHDAAIAGLVDDLETMLRSTAGSGHRGVFVAGPLSEPARIVAPLRLPPRNRLDVLRPGATPPRFELARSHALVRLPVAATWVERGGFRWVLTQGQADPLSGQLDSDMHHMRGSVGRTAQHDRGGSVDQPAGGHGKTRIERVSEEERDRFAREVAAVFEQELAGAELILLQGTPEFAARLSGQLSERIRDRIEEVQISEMPPSTEQLAHSATERGVRLQYERAEALATVALSGTLGERVAVGREAIEAAADLGRVADLVVDEDAIGHFGDAADTRWHQPRLPGEHTEELVRRTLEQAGTVWFRRLDEHGSEAAPGPEPVATLRW